MDDFCTRVRATTLFACGLWSRVDARAFSEVTAHVCCLLVFLHEYVSGHENQIYHVEVVSGYLISCSSDHTCRYVALFAYHNGAFRQLRNDFGQSLGRREDLSGGSLSQARSRGTMRNLLSDLFRYGHIT